MPRPSPRVLALYVLAVGLFVLGTGLDVRALRLVAKPLPVAILAAWVAVTAAPAPFRSRLVFGLVFCALGDLILDTGRFVPGLVAFLIGHLGYVVAFVGETRELHPRRGLFFAAWGVVALALVWSGLGPLALPVALYTTTICAMMWRATAMISRERPWATSLAVGAVVFAASDTLIAVNKFHAPFRGAGFFILSLYWLGQLLIATGGVARSYGTMGSPVSTGKNEPIDH